MSRTNRKNGLGSGDVYHTLPCLCPTRLNGDQLPLPHSGCHHYHQSLFHWKREDQPDLAIYTLFQPFPHILSSWIQLFSLEKLLHDDHSAEDRSGWLALSPNHTSPEALAASILRGSQEKWLQMRVLGEGKPNGSCYQLSRWNEHYSCNSLRWHYMEWPPVNYSTQSNSLLWKEFQKINIFY